MMMQTMFVNSLNVHRSLSHHLPLNKRRNTRSFSTFDHTTVSIMAGPPRNLNTEPRRLHSNSAVKSPRWCKRYRWKPRVNFVSSFSPCRFSTFLFFFFFQLYVFD